MRQRFRLAACVIPWLLVCWLMILLMLLDVSDRKTPFRAARHEPLKIAVDKVLAEQRKLIQEEMAGYNLSEKNLADLIPELRGHPIRTLVISTWRSGSTFLGDILTSHPGTYYNYEPLLDFGIVKIRDPPLADEALPLLKNFFHCNYTGLDRHLQFGKRHNWMFMYNRRLWFQCLQHPDLCYEPEFLTPFCKLFPLLTIKLTRLRLSLVEELLADRSLNVKVVLLVRDPRGTLQSRSHEPWCFRGDDCSKPENLCSDLEADYTAATYLIRAFPYAFTAVRYEDLATDPYATTSRLLSFLGLQFHSDVVKFLETHTQVNIGGPESTFRNSRSRAFHWRKKISYPKVAAIQKVCAEAMRVWGYVSSHNETHQAEFHPLTSYTL